MGAFSKKLIELNDAFEYEEEPKYFKNIPGLRGLQTKVPPMTKVEKVAFERGRKDIVFFAEHYVSVLDGLGGFNKIKLRPYQRQFVYRLQKNKFNIFNTSRQIGKTVTIVVALLHFAVYRENLFVGIAGNVPKTAHKMLESFKDYYAKLPLNIQSPVITWNVKKIKLENSIQIITAVIGADGFRGDPIYWLITDERAFSSDQDWEDFSDAVNPAMTANPESRTTHISTPNDFNHFWRACEKAKANEFGDKNPEAFRYMEVHWWEVEGRTLAFKKNEIGRSDAIDPVALFRRNYECVFLILEKNFLSSKAVKKFTIKEPIEVTAKGEMRYYFPPYEGHTYVMGVDPARGKKHDFTIISLFDITNPLEIHQVAIFRSNIIDELYLPPLIDKLGREYFDAYVIYESNLGVLVLHTLINQYEYPNIVSESHIKLGFYTSGASKKRMLFFVRLLIEAGLIKLYDYMTINEMSNYYIGMRSTSTHHDDIVMAIALAMHILSIDYLELGTSELIKSLVDRAIAEKFED